jgi:hypothetical protein
VGRNTRQSNSEDDKQTVKEKPKKKKKFPVQEQQHFSLSTSGVIPLASSPFCLHLLGRLEPAAGGDGALLFSHCNVVLKSFS